MSGPAREPARLWIVRHGETAYNRDGRWQGSGSDPPLDARGRRQAARLAERLAEVGAEAIYVSPLLRARQTAAPLAAALGLEPIVEPDLREMDHGAWEGRTEAEILAGWPAEHQAFEADPLHARRPGGEGYGDLAARLWPLLDRLAARHAGAGAILVTHGGPMRLVLSRVLDRPLTQRHAFPSSNAEVHTILVDDGVYRLEG